VGLGKYVARRLVILLPTAIGITILTFFLLQMIPGDPAATLLGSRATPATVAALRDQLGLNDSLWTQYWTFLTNLLHGDLGTSIYYGKPVLALIWPRLSVTLPLLFYAVALALTISLPLAAAAARKKDSLVDQTVRIVPLIGLGMPSFWIGIMLVRWLGLGYGLFPVGGSGEGVVGRLHSLFLPALTLAIAMVPPFVRSLRVALLRILDSDFVVTAESKGLTQREVIMHHGLRNGMISTVNVIGVYVAYLVGGTLVVEKVFALQGLGAFMIDGVFNRDFPVIQGVTLVFAVMVVLVNLLTDVVHSAMDPRVVR